MNHCFFCLCLFLSVYPFLFCLPLFHPSPFSWAYLLSSASITFLPAYASSTLVTYPLQPSIFSFCLKFTLLYSIFLIYLDFLYILQKKMESVAFQESNICIHLYFFILLTCLAIFYLR